MIVHVVDINEIVTYQWLHFHQNITLLWTYKIIFISVNALAGMVQWLLCNYLPREDERPTRLDLSLLLFLADGLDDIGAPCDSGKSTGIATADAILWKENHSI